MNIAIIGSNGFIGKHLTETLRRSPSNNIFLFGTADQSVLNGPLPYSKIDLSDSEKISTQFANIDLVYYLASASIPSSSWHQPVLEIEKNLLPFIKFLDCISQLQVKKISFVSSAGTIYGPTNEKVTEDTVKHPFSPYGITKLTMEYFLDHFRIKTGMQYDIFRVSNVYGFGQDTSKGLGIINTFLEKILNEATIQIFGNGEITRNYIYIKDVAELLNLSVLNDLSGSNVFNLSSDDTLKINELVSIMKNIVQEDFKVDYKENRHSDNSAIMLDNARIKAALPGYQFTGIYEGIAETYANIKAQLHQKN